MGLVNCTQSEQPAVFVVTAILVMLSILIIGASICGPVLAWCLSRAEWTRPIVECDPKPRLTGQQVDVRNATTTLIAAMGQEDVVRAASVKKRSVFCR
jgi:2-polyprenyl-6-methoxyphenol hydroxylase-like FAD-dependent oxidoreductase